MRNGAPDHESFHKFFDCWLVEQNQHLQHLISVSKQYEHPDNHSGSNSNPVDEQSLQRLVDRAMQHYQHYYGVKARWVKDDVLGMLSPSWTTSLEDAFLWIGGWRPSMAFHLLYSKSGLQLEAKIHDFIRGLSTGDLADLSPTQFSRVDEQQRRTISEEKSLTEKMAKCQETVADTSMVELSHAVTESMMNGEMETQSQNRALEEEVESTLESKENKLEEILLKADDLLLRTLKAIIETLTPIQAIQFLIAAAELHLRLHDWGEERDAIHRHRHRASTSTSTS